MEHHTAWESAADANPDQHLVCLPFFDSLSAPFALTSEEHTSRPHRVSFHQQYSDPPENLYILGRLEKEWKGKANVNSKSCHQTLLVIKPQETKESHVTFIRVICLEFVTCLQEHTLGHPTKAGHYSKYQKKNRTVCLLQKERPPNWPQNKTTNNNINRFTWNPVLPPKPTALPTSPALKKSERDKAVLHTGAGQVKGLGMKQPCWTTKRRFNCGAFPGLAQLAWPGFLYITCGLSAVKTTMPRNVSP